MRINGFEQIKSFYSWVFNNADKHVKPQHISLYLFLLNQNNRANWVEWFKCPFDLAMSGACIGNKKTYYSCLLDLQNWGLIEHKKGVNNWRAPLVKLVVLNRTSTDTATVPQSEPQGIPQPLPLPTHIYKLITSNVKIVTDNLEGWIKNYKKESKKNEIEIVFPFDSENFIKYWNIWKFYKKEEFRFKYKSSVSEQSALKKLVELANGDEKTCIEIIENSLSNGWKGFFKLNENEKNRGNNKKSGATGEQIAEIWSKKLAES